MEEDPSSQVCGAMTSTTTTRIHHFLIESGMKAASQEEAVVGMRNADVVEVEVVHWHDHRAKNPVQLAKKLVWAAEDRGQD